MKLADVEFESRRGAVVATLTGEIDMSNVDGLATVLVDRLTNETSAMVLDLSAVTYVDSAGIHMVYTVKGRLGDRGQPLSLVVPSDSPAAEALRMAGVLSQLPVAESIEAALRRLE